ncbi:DUF1778 domain-containing protein [Arcicella sp. LKC2W]|uniref:type II toxin-antitoxin system TacA family antitoxin n=1 Tax=Arcicella sp. LKC2W TaxID=2984198 RepID=UPI002B214313|nr:DUF1778 domain-containing protein [Arcicella sp. LKC2W]MEA5458758.1 DUF1778 domain-containing protein [Arcicella sp. LKC2W]
MATVINDRIDVRISKEQKEFVKYASEIRGFKNLTEFIIFCVNKESNEIIAENNLILKSLEDKRVFVDALLNPPAPNEKLKRAQLNYLKFVEAHEIKD